MKKQLILLCVLLFALATQVFALEEVHTDGEGNVFLIDGDDAYGEFEPQLFEEDAAGTDETQLTPLGDPSGLFWEQDPPGFCAWETTGSYQREYEYKIYRIGEQGGQDELVFNTFVYTNSTYQEEYFDASFFQWNCNIHADNLSVKDRIGSGDYYFTVKNIGDGKQYSNSAEVSSKDLENGILHYVEPEAKLETPEPGHWEWPAAIWDDRQSGNLWGEEQTGGNKDERIKAYVIEYAFSETQINNPSELERRIIGSSNGARSGQADNWLQEKLIGDHGAGYYYFRIRAVSKDILKWQNGEYSAWSKGYNLAEASKRITESLKEIGQNASTEDIRKQVQDLNSTELQNALRADIQGAETGTAEALKALEEKLGGPATPVIAEELQENFTADKISIVGANLNNITGDAQDTTLNIGKPNAEHIRQENYNNTFAVDFSMELENVEDSHALQVPVKVTFPVPRGMNPDFLVILHYKADGSFEEVIHNIFREEDGTYSVSFMLTSFSDFLFTEKLASISIDVDEDGGYNVAGIPTGAKLFLARYDTEGKLESIAGQSDLQGSLQPNEKLFLLASDSKPLCPCGELQTRP